MILFSPGRNKIWNKDCQNFPGFHFSIIKKKRKKSIKQSQGKRTCVEPDYLSTIQWWIFLFNNAIRTTYLSFERIFSQFMIEILIKIIEYFHSPKTDICNCSVVIRNLVGILFTKWHLTLSKTKVKLSFNNSKWCCVDLKTLYKFSKH